jgi:hypothetical protein
MLSSTNAEKDITVRTIKTKDLQCLLELIYRMHDFLKTGSPTMGAHAGEEYIPGRISCLHGAHLVAGVPTPTAHPA